MFFGIVLYLRVGCIKRCHFLKKANDFKGKCDACRNISLPYINIEPVPYPEYSTPSTFFFGSLQANFLIQPF